MLYGFSFTKQLALIGEAGIPSLALRWGSSKTVRDQRTDFLCQVVWLTVQPADADQALIELGRK